MGKEKEKKVLTRKQRLLRAMDMPYGSMGKSIRLYICDNVRAEFEGADTILEYDENVVKLGVGKLIITLIGDRFQIHEYSGDITVVEGLISEVKYEKRGKK